MKSLLKEVGRGKRGARDLTYEEAAQAAELILTGCSHSSPNRCFSCSRTNQNGIP